MLSGTKMSCEKEKDGNKVDNLHILNTKSFKSDNYKTYYLLITTYIPSIVLNTFFTCIIYFFVLFHFLTFDFIGESVIIFNMLLFL